MCSLLWNPYPVKVGDVLWFLLCELFAVDDLDNF